MSYASSNFLLSSFVAEFKMSHYRIHAKFDWWLRALIVLVLMLGSLNEQIHVCGQWE
jgi:hypothetical protein